MKKWIFASAVSMFTLLSPAHATHVTVFNHADPAFNNLRYQYFVHSPRFVMESKILTAFRQHHPVYAPPGIGDQIKHAYYPNKTPRELTRLPDLTTASIG